MSINVRINGGSVDVADTMTHVRVVMFAFGGQRRNDGVSLLGSLLVLVSDPVMCPTWARRFLLCRRTFILMGGWRVTL